MDQIAPPQKKTPPATRLCTAEEEATATTQPAQGRRHSPEAELCACVFVSVALKIILPTIYSVIFLGLSLIENIRYY